MAGLLTALLYGAGGYGQGRQQAVQNKQNQQSLDQEQAYRQAEEKRQDAQLTLQQQKAKLDADADLRSRGINPDTNQPFVLPPALQQIRPNNKGKGGPVTDQDQLTHLYSYANWLNQTGQYNAAAGIMDRAKSMESDIRAANTQAGENYRQDQRLHLEAVLADKRSSDEDKRQAQRDIDALNREEEIRGTPTWADTHGTWSDRHGGGKGANKASTDEATWYTKWSKLTTAQNSQVPGVKNPPVIPPDQAARAAKKFSAIDKAITTPNADPRAVAAALAAKEPNAAIKALILERGNVAAEKKQGASSGDTGGSDDGQNPTRGEKIPPRDIWKMVYDSGATPQEATTLTAIAMAESGGDPTNVNTHDPLGNGKFQHAWGLFQLGNGTNDPNAYPGWQDPEQNIQYALQKLRSQGLGAWGTYTHGQYKQFLPQGSG